MGTRMRERGVCVSGVLADSVKADSPANGRPAFRGELSFEQAKRSTWRIPCYRRHGGMESRISSRTSPAYNDYLNLRERRVSLADRVMTIS